MRLADAWTPPPEQMAPQREQMAAEQADNIRVTPEQFWQRLSPEARVEMAVPETEETWLNHGFSAQDWAWALARDAGAKGEAAGDGAVHGSVRAADRSESAG